MKTLIKILCLSVLWFSCDNPTEPEEDNNHIRGYVYNNSGEPVENASIFLTYEVEPISRPTLTMTLSIAEASIVNIWITDFCDSIVSNLVDNEMYDAGTYDLTWDATDNIGNQVTNGQYNIYVEAGGLEATQSIFLQSMEYNNLESIEGYNYHGLTDDEGYFSIPIECLSFGVIQTITFESGNDLGEFIIPHTIKLSIFHEDDGFYESDFYEVDSETGLNIDITLP